MKLSELIRVIAREIVDHHEVTEHTLASDLAVQSTLASIEVDRVVSRIEALEARVEQLEDHPAGCSCTRCTG